MPECPGSHCSTVTAEINAICKSDGFTGNVVYVQGPNGYCYCKCSCLAYNTPIAISATEWKRIQDFQVGDTVLCAKPDKTWQPARVAFSDGTGGNDSPLPYAIYIEIEGGIRLIVTPEHPFLMPSGKLKRADRLSTDDSLVGESFKAQKIVRVLHGEYTGGIHNISTSTGKPGEPLSDHLINTAGVISGDYYAQLYLLDAGMLAESQVGTVEYEQSHSFQSAYGVATISPSGLEEFRFVPARKFTPPAGAAQFLPDYMTTPAPGMMEPLDNTVPLEIAEYLVRQFRHFYPDVVYHVEWNDNTVNAYAWRSGGQRHVALLGGLIRHRSVRQEGLGLVLAHEIGHHYGGPPVYPNNGLSCEGQADWWGANIGMREVWWGEEYIRQTLAAADQLYNLFSTGLIMTISEQDEAALFAASGNCGHPPAACRRDTYIAATQAQPKPACAGIVGCC